MMSWEPIETAKKDKVILACRLWDAESNFWTYQLVHWHDGHWIGTDECYWDDVTHWSELYPPESNACSNSGENK